MLAFLISFVLVLIFQPIYINVLKKRGVRGQPIREDGPKDHLAKAGTPTMGGLVVVAAVTITTFLLADITNKFVLCTLFIMISHAAIGFVDDWRKIKYQNSKGLSGPYKLFWQSLVVLLASYFLYQENYSTLLTFPFFKNLVLDLGILFIPFSVLVVVGSSNAVNLTDGLDGLAIGPIMTVAATYAIFAYVTGHKNIADYLQLTHISGIGGLGFLWYNTFPAQVFMGDLGSLALGATLGFCALLVKQELLLVIAGGIFVIEALSVLIQRYYYKLTKKRVFRMAPIHHHYELKGWAEPKIIVRFWIISIVLALISITTLKLR
ncbi:UNVERIFIED_CONTAM: hypothetical protein GTU68_011557 [Idotea baltica]|nr:hypothetical protein [Idotea baltica]